MDKHQSPTSTDGGAEERYEVTYPACIHGASLAAYRSHCSVIQHTGKGWQSGGV